ncbi:MAG: biotin carboxylase [Mitsuaria chitosanitabida]|uniref:carboxyl transferase domain-containing protein n=1 Tax=Roseateles chitosanitabidus TaxID=65048 RepID=UPI001AFE6587|nr:carboxyl transferase domain-containing protein [Roseateles chitosanitabidus]MBO9685778.1 biotin carboxylase [Roseateles chitosanitabidus]
MPSLVAPLSATVQHWLVAPGDLVRRGQPVVRLEAMKMEHELSAPADGRVAECFVGEGELVQEGDALMAWTPVTSMGAMRPSVDAPATDAAPDPATTSTSTSTRADHRAWVERHALLDDAARPEAIAKRHALGMRTARENLAALCDPGSLIEFGALAVAAQTARRPIDELRAQTPADGVITGKARLRGRPIAVMAYDATVLAGTQGYRGHQKSDRILELAERERLPFVLFAEGGGGRPGDTDMPVVAGLHAATFARMAALAGQVPTIGIAAGRCFAGNAALLGCCDVVIATRGSNIGLGGPAMIEGGGLGRFEPEAIGPAPQLAQAGVVDLLVDDETQACERARALMAWMCRLPGDTAPDAIDPARRAAREPALAADQAPLDEAIPEIRQRAYPVRPILERLFDTGSLIELGAGHGGSVITAAARLHGQAVALVASDCAVMGGAVDGAASRKLARFWRLCERLGMPVVSLIDSPGFMVGPQAEATGQLREAGELFRAAAALTVPLAAVVMRRAFGLGAMALAGGSLHRPLGCASWPSGEFGAMGLEGAVRLGYRKELAAAPDGPERQALFERLLAAQVARGQALAIAETLEIDAVIAPRQTRDWLLALLGG